MDRPSTFIGYILSPSHDRGIQNKLSGIAIPMTASIINLMVSFLTKSNTPLVPLIILLVLAKCAVMGYEEVITMYIHELVGKVGVGCGINYSNGSDLVRIC